MGLDAVELVMEIEEEFGISIAEDEVVYFRTLGNIHDYLLEKCEGRKRLDCPTRSAFYRLRRVMGVVLNVEPRSLQPTTPLLPLLGPRGRRHKWMRLQRDLALELPPLENRAGAGVGWGMLIAAVGCLIMAAVLTRDPFVACAAAMVGLLPGVLLGYVVGVCWTPTVGLTYRTVGGLARGLVTLNDEEFRASEEPSTENDSVWGRLCDVLVRQLDVRREILHRETCLAEDLGV
jgi:hypothetical protein